MCKSNYSSHAIQRGKQRNVAIDKSITVDEIKTFPLYTIDNGCEKYLDMKNGIIYYIRGKNVVTVVKSHNPIQMLKNYAFGANIDFNTLCRDHVFNNCNRNNCKYTHINF